ncbi:histidine phosphatase family protein [Arthrobacter sp. JSM 101049]|uniref:histidine phosphatase family protein n=1 Tax=Arthrobacter sp. JSM 101049 TaxID=929097 RepID=UPI003562B974
MRLYLVRHGQTASNVGGYLDTTVPGAPLNELGQDQARLLVRTLDGLPLEALYASTQRRAQQTAAPLAADRGLEVAVRDGLREIAAGELEMRNDEDAVRAYFMAFGAFAAGDLQARMPGGETGAQVLGRFDEVVEEISASGVEAAAIVSHGAMLRTWTGYRCVNLDAEYVLRNPLTNTGVIAVDGSPSSGWLADTWIGEPVAAPEEEAGPTGESVDDAVEDAGDREDRSDRGF